MTGRKVTVKSQTINLSSLEGGKYGVKLFWAMFRYFSQKQQFPTISDRFSVNPSMHDPDLTADVPQGDRIRICVDSTTFDPKGCVASVGAGHAREWVPPGCFQPKRFRAGLGSEQFLTFWPDDFQMQLPYYLPLSGLLFVFFGKVDRMLIKDRLVLQRHSSVNGPHVGWAEERSPT